MHILLIVAYFLIEKSKSKKSIEGLSPREPVPSNESSDTSGYKGVTILSKTMKIHT